MRLGLVGRMLIGSALCVCAVGVIFVLLVNSIDGVRASNREAAAAERSVAVAADLSKRLTDLEAGRRNSALASIPGFGRRLRSLPESSRQRSDLERILSQVGAFAGKSPRAVVRSGDVSQLERIQRSLTAFETRQRAAAIAARAEVDDKAESALGLGAIRLLVLVGLIGVTVLLATRGVVIPVKRVAGAARRLRQGDLSARVREGGAAEAGALTTSFNAMATTICSDRDELETRNAELAAQREELERNVDALTAEKERIQRFHDFISRLSAGVSAELSVDQGLRDFGRVLLEEMVAAAEADAATLYGFDGAEREGGMELIASLGLEADRLPEAVRAGESLAGRAVAEARPITGDHGETGLRLPAMGADVTARHEIHLPVGPAGAVIGVVSLARSGETGFDPSRVAELEQMLGPASVGLAKEQSLQAANHAAEVNRSVLDAAHDAYAAVDIEGLIVTWTPQAEAMFGYSEEEALGVPLLEIVLPDDERVRLTELGAELLRTEPKGGQGERGEVTAMRRDGWEFVMEMSATVVGTGSRRLISVFMRNVTDRVRAEEERRAGEAVSRVLAEAKRGDRVLPAVMRAIGETMEWGLGAFWVYDEATTSFRCGDIWHGESDEARRFGASLKAAAYRPAKDDSHSDTRVAWRAWETQEPQWALIPAERRSAAGAAGLFSSLAVPLYSSGERIGVLEFWGESNQNPNRARLEALKRIGQLVSQVVERRRAEREAEQLKNEFFALVSHELRTPLTSIIGYLDIVSEEEAGEVNAEQQRYLAIIDRNARRLLRLVGDLLFVAQVESGTLALERGEVQLDDVAENSVEAARPRADSGGVTVSVETEPLTLLGADHDRLGQLIDNLLSNALKFTPEGGNVKVTVRHDDEKALIEVTDTGAGISQEEIAHLFERFYRAPAATDAAIPGIGLGLSICKAIVDGHGGGISVDSVVGEGTTFRVELPCEAEAAAAGRAPALRQGDR